MTLLFELSGDISTCVQHIIKLQETIEELNRMGSPGATGAGLPDAVEQMQKKLDDAQASLPAMTYGAIGTFNANAIQALAGSTGGYAAGGQGGGNDAASTAATEQKKQTGYLKDIRDKITEASSFA